MVKNLLKLICFIVFSQTITAQDETCETPEDVLLDLNSVTKCSIETDKEKKNSKVFSVQVSSRRRVVRKKRAVSSVLNGDQTQKVDNIKSNASIVGTINVSNESVIEKVPFNHVEEVPLFKSCEKVAIVEQKKCFNSEISKHINKNLVYPKEAYNKSIQGRVLVQFVIDKTGQVTDLNIRTPYQGDLLGEEAKRIVNKLPKFIPGKHNGEVVKVKYGVPIGFKIPGREPLNVKKESKVIKFANVENLVDIDQLPLFDKCAKKDDESQDCFNKNFIEHINKHFTYPLAAVKNNIEGKVMAYFVISNTGEVVNITTRAISGKELLKEATKELIQKLPVFKPGKHNGEVVNVKHAFPITFKLD